MRPCLILFVCLLLASCGSKSSRTSQSPPTNKTARFTQFYARDPNLPVGEKTVLCYGVEDAQTLELDPPVEKVWPAYSRCIDVAPTKETTYTLTAKGEDGAPVTKSVTVSIGASLPKILEVSVNSLTVSPGEQVTVCYKVRNAPRVKVSPGKLLDTGVTAPGQGCYMDTPSKDTTYTVVASNAGGAADTEHVTVRMK